MSTNRFSKNHSRLAPLDSRVGEIFSEHSSNGTAPVVAHQTTVPTGARDGEQNSDGARKMYRESFRHPAMEEISIKAGKFKAFKIERYETLPGARRKGAKVRAIEHVYYYSPETRSIVKYRREDPNGATREVELLKFTQGN